MIPAAFAAPGIRAPVTSVFGSRILVHSPGPVAMTTTIALATWLRRLGPPPLLPAATVLVRTAGVSRFSICVCVCVCVYVYVCVCVCVVCVCVGGDKQARISHTCTSYRTKKSSCFRANHKPLDGITCAHTRHLMVFGKTSRGARYDVTRRRAADCLHPRRMRWAVIRGRGGGGGGEKGEGPSAPFVTTVASQS